MQPACGFDTLLYLEWIAHGDGNVNNRPFVWVQNEIKLSFCARKVKIYICKLCLTNSVAARVQSVE